MNLKRKLKIIQNKRLPGFVSVAHLSHPLHNCFRSSDVRVYHETLSCVTANVTFRGCGLSDGKKIGLISAENNAGLRPNCTQFSIFHVSAVRPQPLPLSSDV